MRSLQAFLRGDKLSRFHLSFRPGFGTRPRQTVAWGIWEEGKSSTTEKYTMVNGIKSQMSHPVEIFGNKGHVLWQLSAHSTGCFQKTALGTTAWHVQQDICIYPWHVQQEKLQHSILLSMLCSVYIKLLGESIQSFGMKCQQYIKTIHSSEKLPMTACSKCQHYKSNK